MKISIAVMLFCFSFLWLIGILMFYGDSMMTINHAELYTGVCFAIILLGIYLIYSHNKNKKSN
nr:putative tellurium resistance membrane protein TerC [Mucilaginibacter sp. E4BP6]